MAIDLVPQPVRQGRARRHQRDHDDRKRPQPLVARSHLGDCPQRRPRLSHYPARVAETGGELRAKQENLRRVVDPDQQDDQGSSSSETRRCTAVPEIEPDEQLPNREEQRRRDRTDPDIAKVLGVSRVTVYNIRKRYHHKGEQHILDVLHDEPRTGRPIQFDSTVEAKVTMIACSAPPQGTARWTLHLIAEKLIKLDLVDTISYESVRSILKKTS